MIPELTRLRSSGDLSALDEHFARAMGRLAGEERSEVLLAAGLVSRWVSNGHVCLDIPGFAAGGFLLTDSAEKSWEWPAADEWLEMLADSEMVEVLGCGLAGSPSAPLVLDAAGRLYLRRYWDDQQALAAALRGRVDAGAAADGASNAVNNAVNDAVNEAVLADGLHRLFPALPDGEGGPDLQRQAAEGAVRSRFFVISGGPGTGKTSTVVKILALLVEQAAARGEPAPRMQMVAPTGKAAAHLQGAVQRRLSSLACSEAVRAGVPLSASTIHRSLGLRGGSGMRFRHTAENPLEIDVLLVDEASMVDLVLMSRLVDALPPSARLILLGDRDQLASVEAGAVLGDIGRGVDGEPVTAPRSVVHLTRNYRFAAESAIEELIQRINTGDAEGALALLDDETRPEVRRVEPTPGRGWGKALEETIAEGYRAFREEASPSGQLEALDRFRILCAHRHGPGGVDALNAQAECLLGFDPVEDLSGVLQAGRPIGMTRNNYELDLYNGDVGIIGVDPESPERGHRAFFQSPGEEPRWLSPLSIGAAETVFATTVHKSQGSEFAEIALVLPEEVSPILSRELVYTGISRARERVTVFASREVLVEAIGRRIERSSGLSAALWG